MRGNILLLIAMLLMSLTVRAQEVVDLRTEGMREPLGIDNTQPHFSWIISSENPFLQTA